MWQLLQCLLRWKWTVWVSWSAVKGVKLTIGDGSVIVDLQITVKYGVPIPQVAQNVQEAVTNAVESMTELKVCQVNVRISGVTFGENAASAQ